MLTNPVQSVDHGRRRLLQTSGAFALAGLPAWGAAAPAAPAAPAEAQSGAEPQPVPATPPNPTAEPYPSKRPRIVSTMGRKREP